MTKSNNGGKKYWLIALPVILILAGLTMLALNNWSLNFGNQTSQSTEVTAQPLPSVTAAKPSLSNAPREAASPVTTANTSEVVPAATTTFYVATTGADSNPGTLAAPWRTLQNAANRVTPGAVVQVRGGVYSENVTFNVGGSAAGGYVTFQNYPGEVPVVDGSNLTPSQNAASLFTINSKSYLIIRGFELRNFRTASANVTPVAIYIQGSGDHIEIRNNLIHNIETTAPSNGNAHGLAVYGNQAPQSINNLIIEGNSLYNLKLGSSEVLVVNGNVEQFSILNNLIHDNNNIGIDIIGFENTAPDPNYDQARNGVVRGNKVYNISSANNPNYGGGLSAGGIYVDGGRDLTIEQNEIFNSDIGIELASEHLNKVTSGVIARNNLIYNNLTTGISIGGYDAQRGGTINCLIINNTLFRNNSSNSGAGEFGMQFYARNNTFKNNIVYAANENTPFIINPLAENTGNIFDYNFFYSANGKGSWLWLSDNAITDFNTYKTQSGNDSHSKFSDPLFVNNTATEPNLRVVATSPVINAGQNLAESGSNDFFGQARQLEGQTDIGAVETPLCANALAVTKNGDDSSCGTLRVGATTAKTGQTVTINLAAGATILLNSPVQLNKGVTLTASAGCPASGPQITLRGAPGSNGKGLILSGGNKVENLKITGFSEQELVALQGGGNKLTCVVAAQ